MKKSILFKKILEDVKFHQKELAVSGVFGMLMAFSLVTLRLSAPLSASVTNLGGYGYGQTGTDPVVNCTQAEVVLACALGTRNCPEECKKGNTGGNYGYGQTTTPKINPADCKKASTILACTLGTANCPSICKTIKKSDSYGYGATRAIVPPVKRR